MIDLQQLRQLVIISECGTISKAAEETFISQPALSRSMQHMEEDLGVTLFTRLKNKIELNENGNLAVNFAKKLLTDFDYYMNSIKAFDKSRRTISLGLCTLSPMWQLVPELSANFSDKTVTSEIKSHELLVKGLLYETYQIIVTSKPCELPNCITGEYCKEHLYLYVPHNHKPAKKTSVSYAGFDGVSMLLYEQLGT